MISLRTPKGTVDLDVEQSLTQDAVIQKITKIFRTHNGTPIDTPTFELRELLLNKYGEDAKLIYNLEDQGGDICSLRYDLTVPFSRYLSMNRVSKMRRYQIGSVFRRDNPSFRTGRLREFVQADFDICGENLPMVHDSEILKIIYDILKEFDLKDRNGNSMNFAIRVNDRRILVGLLEMADVPAELRGTVCSTIDKVDKLPEDELNSEFAAKGLGREQISKISGFMQLKGSNEEILEFLRMKMVNSSPRAIGIEEDASLVALDSFKQAVEELEMLLRYAKGYGVENIKVDLSLARGLDYYTGLIIEACYLDSDVGSVVGGGRYDNLCRSVSNFSVPCVGFSVGVSRISALSKPTKAEFDVFVGSGFGLMLEDRMCILSRMWRLGVRSETFTGKRVNYKSQVEFARKNNFKMAIFTGENELRKGVVGILDIESMAKREIPRSELDSFILNSLN